MEKKSHGETNHSHLKGHPHGAVGVPPENLAVFEILKMSEVNAPETTPRQPIGICISREVFWEFDSPDLIRSIRNTWYHVILREIAGSLLYAIPFWARRSPIQFGWFTKNCCWNFIKSCGQVCGHWYITTSTLLVWKYDPKFLQFLRAHGLLKSW